MEALFLPEIFSPQLLAWFGDRGVGYAIGALWIVTLLRERMGLINRSEKLSDALCRAIESGSAERAKITDESLLRHDWTVRSILEAFTALAERRPLSVPVMQQPRQPTKRAESERPPPLPPINPAPPPKRTK